MDLAKFRRDCGECTDEELVKAVWEIDKSVTSPDQAKAFIWCLVKRLLDTERYGLAGLVLWGEALFNCRPMAVQKLLHKVRTTQNLIVLGGAALGKTYTCMCWCLLDWVRDPAFTEIKIISTSGGHAKANAFSTLQRLYAASIVPLPGVCMSEFIGLDVRNRHTGTSLVAVPQGDMNEGRAVLQGFHPIPRTTTHPVFGSSSRVRCLVDEAEEAPPGIFHGISNLLASGFGVEHVKVVCLTNPRDVTSKLAQLAEPTQGWSMIDLDKDKTWVSPEGNWTVLRLDGADSENVVERKLVYPGFLTWEGYQAFAQELGGNSPKYYCFGRGMYSLQALQSTLIPYSLLEGVVGQFIFDQKVIHCAGIDLAYEIGGDRVIVTVGSYGRGIGFTPVNGTPTLWKKPRWVVQLDQIYELPKQKTLELADSIATLLKGLNVNPNWVACDKTGVGLGTFDALVANWNASVRGIGWGTDAGNRKILAEDSDYAVEGCLGIDTEMMLRCRKYLEFGYLCFHPQVQTQGLFKELSGRRYQPATQGPSGKSRIKIENKKEFKKRLGFSPDKGDSLIMMLHVCALMGPEKARFGADRPAQPLGSHLGIREQSAQAYIDFSSDL